MLRAALSCERRTPLTAADSVGPLPNCSSYHLSELSSLSQVPKSKVVTTHLCTSTLTSSSGCIRTKCCLKLSRRGHSFSALAQLVAKHFQYLVPRLFSLWTDFSCLCRSFTVAKPLFTLGHSGNLHLNGASCRAWCFLSYISRFPRR